MSEELPEPRHDIDCPCSLCTIDIILNDNESSKKRIKELEAINEELLTHGAGLEAQRSRAIYILDGNSDPIDWKDRTQPELLRKLCEHLEAYREFEANQIKGYCKDCDNYNDDKICWMLYGDNPQESYCSNFKPKQ
jgi:hypothetical protein